jgi:hypothetical protein
MNDTVHLLTVIAKLDIGRVGNAKVDLHVFWQTHWPGRLAT